MSQIKDYDMKLAKEFGQIAQAVISRPTNIIKRIEKANDKVDFSSGRFQEIAIDIEHITEDISSKNFYSMESIENIILGLVVQLNRCESFEADLVAEVEHRSGLQMEVDNLKKQIKNLMMPTNAKRSR
jgi:hypothetical protein